jgi:hypothetical protein
VIVLAGIAGGLVMSAVKRDRQVKDFGALLPAIGGSLVADTSTALRTDYASAMLRAGFTGVPYKILAVESGSHAQGLATFLAWSVPARLSRWVLMVLAARGVAVVVRRYVRRPDRVLWVLWAVVWGTVYVVYFSMMDW